MTRLPKPLAVLLTLASIVTFAAVAVAQAVLSPVVFACFVIALVWPVQDALLRGITRCAAKLRANMLVRSLISVVTGVPQFVGGSQIGSCLAGQSLPVSPVPVLVSVFAGGFLWDVPGALIGPPALIVALTLCEEFPVARPCCGLLSGQEAGRRLRRSQASHRGRTTSGGRRPAAIPGRPIRH